MAEKIWNVQIHGASNGSITRLGLGHAWVWTRSDGSTDVFDCGMEISHVLDAVANRIGVGRRDVTATNGG